MWRELPRLARWAGIALMGVAAFGTGCATAGPAKAEHTATLRQYELDSGLRVAVAEEDDGDTVGVAWVVDVGALDDPPSRPGLSHLVEHLVLMSPDGPRGALARQLERLGGVVNGETKLDRTIFYAILPRAALPAAMAAMSERFAGAGALMNDALLAKERGVVAEEDRLRRGIEGSAGARLALAAVAGAGQPLSRLAQDVDPAALAAVSVAEVRHFLDAYYRPERMTLALAGGFSRGTEQALIAALPVALKGTGALGRTPVRRRIGPGAPPVTPSDQIAAHPTTVRSPQLWISWNLPPMRVLDAVPFEVLANVVGQVLSDRLREGALPDVLRVGCTAVESTLGGGLICRAHLKTLADAAAVRTGLLTDIGSLSHLLDLSLARTRTYASLLVHGSLLASAFDFESLARRTVVRANLMHDDPNADLSEVMRGIGKLTPEMVAALAGRYLRPEASRAVLLVPDARVARREVGRQTGEGAAPDSPASDEGRPAMDTDDDVLDVRGVARPVGAAAARTVRLANGLTVVALQRPGFASVSMVLGFHADPQPGDAPGAEEAALFARSHPTLPSPIWTNLLWDAWRTSDAYAESISTHSSNLPAAFERLARETETLSVRWPAPAYDRWVQGALLASGTPAHRADMAFAQELWAGHPYAHQLTREQARQVTEPQVRRWLDRIFRPANGTLIVVGDVDPAQVLKMAADQLSDWSAEPAPPPPPPLPPARSPRPTMPVLKTDDPSRDLFRIHFGCFLSPVDAARDGIVSDVVEELIENELTHKLRDELGVTYDVRVRGEVLRGGTVVLDGIFDVSAAGHHQALGLLASWLDPSAASPDERAIARARWRVAQQSAIAGTTNRGVARYMFAAWNLGLPLASLDDFPQKLASLSAADIRAAVTGCRASAVISVLGPPAP